MSDIDIDAEAGAETLVMDFEIESRPEKVWRAISIPALREAWLPGDALSDEEPTVVVPGQKVQYKMRDNDPPFLDSVVTFEVYPRGDDGARLRIIHQVANASYRRAALASNDNRPRMRLAA